MPAESMRSHRHREPIGNGGFLSLACSFSLLPESEKEKSPRACGLVGGTTIRHNAGQWKVCTRCVWQCRTSHRRWLSLARHGLSDVEITEGRYRPPWAFTVPAYVGKLYRIRKDPIWVTGACEKMGIPCGSHMISASFADWEYPKRRSEIPGTFYTDAITGHIYIIGLIQKGSYEANKPKISNRKVNHIILCPSVCVHSFQPFDLDPISE